MNGGPAPTACLAANFLLQNDDAEEEDGWFRYAQGPLPLAGISCARACMHHCRTCRSWDSSHFGSAPYWPALQHCLPVPRCRRALKLPAISIAPCLQELPPQRRWVPRPPLQPAPGPGFEPLQGYCNTRPPTPAFAATCTLHPVLPSHPSFHRWMPAPLPSPSRPPARSALRAAAAASPPADAARRSGRVCRHALPRPGLAGRPTHARRGGGPLRRCGSCPELGAAASYMRSTLAPHPRSHSRRCLPPPN